MTHDAERSIVPSPSAMLPDPGGRSPDRGAGNALPDPMDFDAWMRLWIEFETEAPYVEGESWDLRYAAGALTGAIEMRGMIVLPGEPARDPNSWAGIDAYEVLFQNVVHQGVCVDVGEREHLENIADFADFLGRHGVIPEAEHLALQGEFDLWAERLLHVWKDGGWYDRDGRHLSPAQLDARNRRGRRRA